MMHDQLANNKLTITGKVLDTPSFYHEVFDEKFYTFMVEVPRLSETPDRIPALVSEKIMENYPVGSYVSLEGQLRTYNKNGDGKRKLLMFAFARNIESVSEETFHATKAPNVLILRGFLCKEPQYRTTPFGREITDMLLAVNRNYKKSDYIPAIAWGRNAKFCKKLNTGREVEIEGRLQSRDYIKKTADGNQCNTAFEVSVTKIKLLEGETPVQ